MMKHRKALLLPLLALSSFSAAQERPNLVLIVADQWRGDALGCLGLEPVQTPCLDALASEGVNFTNAVSSYPVSSPARGMLMTGLYPPASKVTGNCNSDNTPYNIELDQEARCWSDVLSKQGYSMGYIGKWHLDTPRKPYVDTHNNKGKTAWNEWCPPERRHGFTYWEAYGTYDNHLRPMYWSSDDSRDNFHYIDMWGPEYEAGKAIEFITSQEKKRPFALVVSMNPPHTGYELVPDRYKSIYSDLDVEALCNGRPDIAPAGTPMGDYFRQNIRNYYACMTGVDENVGRIVEALKKQGLFNNTIVVFTSDHGIQMGSHDMQGKNIFYEQSMRIPMIISYPKRLDARRDTSTQIAFADLYPTLLSLMGQEKNIPTEVQTKNLATLLLSGKEDGTIEQPYYYITPKDGSTGYRGLRTEHYTFAVHATQGTIDSTLLFDRTTDPLQMNNIAAANPQVVDKLKAHLRTFLAKQNDPFAAYLLPRPTKVQMGWHEAEIGLVFHYDLHVFDGIRYGQGNNRINPIEDYNIFSPSKLNTDQWAQTAAEAGAKFAVLTATHETGFGLWQSDVNPYCLKAVRWGDGKADIIRDFCNSCRKYGIKPGIYIGIRWNSLLGIHNFKAEGTGEFAKNRQEWYRHLCEKMTEELCSRYGELFMVWYDGGAGDPRGDGPDVEPIVNRLQPNCLFYHNIDRADFRWSGSETGTVEYPCYSSFPIPCSHHNRLEGSTNHSHLLKHGDADGNYWVPPMADTPLRGANGRHEWFWEPDDESNLLSVADLTDKYEKSVGRGATLILGVTPDTCGLIPEGDVVRLKEWHAAIDKKYSTPTAGSADGQTIELPKPTKVDRLMIEEDISQGQRVRAYRVEAMIGKRWRTICNGQSIGHKRIEQFAPVKATAIRLVVEESVGEPIIRGFRVFAQQ